MLKVGLPSAFNALQTNLCVILVTGAVGLFGTAALAGYGTASRLDYVMIPILFGLSSAVLTMVGINVGAGQGARARHVAWVSSFVGVVLTGAIGLAAALAPAAWVGLFTHDPDVLAPGVTYLSIVGGAYALYGFGFVMSFAAQGAGKILWATVAVSARLVVSAGFGWIAVTSFGGTMTTLAYIVAASFVVYAVFAGFVTLQRSAWKVAPSLRGR
jgi:Na+-driven multidrug efflux pump